MSVISMSVCDWAKLNWAGLGRAQRVMYKSLASWLAGLASSGFKEIIRASRGPWGDFQLHFTRSILVYNRGHYSVCDPNPNPAQIQRWCAQETAAVWNACLGHQLYESDQPRHTTKTQRLCDLGIALQASRHTARRLGDNVELFRSPTH